MPQDFLKTISELQDAAVGNCRKRIEDAALRAKGIIRRDPPGAENAGSGRRPASGITSILKRKHGL